VAAIKVTACRGNASNLHPHLETHHMNEAPMLVRFVKSSV